MTETTNPNAAEHLAALEERVRDGDTTVTAKELADAHAMAELARLTTEAAQRVARVEAEASLDRDRAEFRSGPFADTLQRLHLIQATYAKAVATSTALQEQIEGYRSARNAARSEARRLGLTEEFDDAVPGISRDAALERVHDDARGRHRLIAGFDPNGPDRFVGAPWHSPEYVASVNSRIAAAFENSPVTRANRERAAERADRSAKRRLQLEAEAREAATAPQVNFDRRGRARD